MVINQFRYHVGHNLVITFTL